MDLGMSAINRGIEVICVMIGDFMAYNGEIKVIVGVWG
jgi:hypothetical protein